jgi:antitoxin component of MazEF toxin-antitoxin module
VSAPPKILYTQPVQKWGESYVIRLPLPLRKFLGLQEGDEVAFRKVGRVFLVAVVRPCSVIPVSEAEVREAVEVLKA